MRLRRSGRACRRRADRRRQCRGRRGRRRREHEPRAHGRQSGLYGEAFGWLAAERYELTSQGEAAERVAEHWKLSREALDAFAVRSHQRAAAAAEAGYFTREIAPSLSMR
jgi:acetyl-CoA acetyltransferase